MSTAPPPAMSAIFCSGLPWSDTQLCIQIDILSFLVPLGTCLLSVLLLTSAAISRCQQNAHLSSFEPLATSESETELAGRARYSPPSPRQYFTTHGPYGTALEGLAIVSDVLLDCIWLIRGRASSQNSEALPTPASYTRILYSTYLLLLFGARKWASSRCSPSLFNFLWGHSAVLYGIQWGALLLLSAWVVIQELPLVSSTITLFHVAIFTVLVLLNASAPKVPVDDASWDDDGPTRPGKEEIASLLSRLTFSWMHEVIWKAYRSTLEASHLNDLRQQDKAAVLAPAFRAIAIARLPLLRRMFYFFRHYLLVQSFWALTSSLMLFIPATLLRLILRQLENPGTMTSSAAWLCVVGLFVSQAGFFITNCQCLWMGQRINLQLRAILVSEIYGKVLRRKMARPPTAEKKTEADQEENEGDGHANDGKIINFISVDTETICGICGYLYLVWVNFPVQVSIALYLLYNIVGVSGIIGVAIMIALMPIHVVLVKKLAAVRGEVLAASDARLQASTELIANIRIIKYCGWESVFGNRVLALRKIELNKLRLRFLWWSLNMAVFYSIPLFATALTCFFYTVIFGNSLESSVAFPALATFAILRIPLDSMAEAISYILQAYVSVVRIDQFLQGSETEKYSQLSEDDGPGDAIGFINATLEWPFASPTQEQEDPESSPSFQLRNLNIRFKENGLNIVSGPSGSGKSSLLLALLGEMELRKGTVHLPHHTAYCSQEPWILNSSIRANILFGLHLDAARYSKVLDATALGPDLAALAGGDQTLAGEKGNRLSGGQKQRVALARALYSGSRYVLLDDCLSSVDSETGKHIFFNAIKGPLMRDRTCILATHHTQLVLPDSDYVILMDKGRVTGHGTAEELVSAELIDASLAPSALQSPTKPSETSPNEGTNYSGEWPAPADMTEVFSSVTEEKSYYKESKKEGAIPWSVTKWYLQKMGPTGFWVIVLLGFAAQQMASLGANMWMKEWARQYDMRLRKSDETTPLVGSAGSSAPINAAYYLAIYCILMVTCLLFSLGRDATTFYGSLQASARIYKELLDSILHAKLIFFDRVPSGQITNRLSKDVGTIDQELATSAISTAQAMASIAVVLGLITAVLPAFLLAGVVICVAYYFITVVFISCSRDLRRIESIERSPLYQQVGESINGHVTIRAYGRTSMFTAENHRLIDRFRRPGMLSWASREWLTVRVSTLSASVVFFAGSFIFWKANSVSAGTAGLVLTYAVTLTEQVLWMVQLYGITQQNFNSVERTIEYTEVEQEAPEPPIPPTHVAADWPTQGGIIFNNYSTRYAPELESVLDHINLDVQPGERVAVVGRTGAGKSTLALALIRGLEADEGQIVIDGVDISSLKLETLRRAVTVVPQDPTLFDGSLRDNLDPLRQYCDKEIFDVLKKARLSTPTSAAPDNANALPTLDQPAIALSLGQRQLVCIARALLRRSRILILDEATASIDHETDALIQRTIRNSTDEGTTVITIAHRLQTVADYDRVLVLDKGRIVEQGSVAALLTRRGPQATFRRLCEESGDIDKIERIARIG